MLGLSYGEVFLLVGATAALIGPKDLPIIARTAGRWVGRAIGYVQMARGQFDSVMQQSQASQVHKELQDAMAQLEAIRYEIRSISVMNPGPISRRLMDATETTASTDGTELSQKVDTEIQAQTLSKECNSSDLNSSMLQSQAVKYARLAESTSIRSSLTSAKNEEQLYSDGGLLNVLPISAESAGMLPSKREDVKGSDIMLEAILEEEVAHGAKQFFAQPQNQIKDE